jgi:hypothetical protein
MWLSAVSLALAAPVPVKEWVVDSPHDWTVNTSIGRFGFAEIHYTLVMTTSGSPESHTENYFYVGPIGKHLTRLSSSEVGGAALSGLLLFVCGVVVWTILRFNKKGQNERAA